MTLPTATTKVVPSPTEETEVIRPPSVPLEVKHRRHVKEEEGFPGMSYYRWFVFPKRGKDCGCIFPSEGTIIDRAFEVIGTTGKNDNRLLDAEDHGTYLILDIITGTSEEKIEELVKVIGRQTRYRD